MGSDPGTASLVAWDPLPRLAWGLGVLVKCGDGERGVARDGPSPRCPGSRGQGRARHGGGCDGGGRPLRSRHRRLRPEPSGPLVSSYCWHLGVQVRRGREMTEFEPP